MAKMAKGTKKTKGTKYVSGKINIIFPNISTPQYFDTGDKPHKLESDKKEYKKNKGCIYDETKRYWKSPTGERLEYNCQILIEKNTEEANRVKQAINEEWQKNINKLKKTSRNPLEDGDSKADELETKDKNGEHYRDCYVLKCKTCYKPLVVEGKKKITPEDEDFDIDHNGWVGRVSLRFDYYSGMGGGLTVRLNQVQFLEDNPDLDFGGGCDFDIEEEEEEENDFKDNKANDKVDYNDDSDLPFVSEDDEL